ncbi:MAG TPA: hypothetical protein VF771_02320 [Longimicrobiaceae bacterium]
MRKTRVLAAAALLAVAALAGPDADARPAHAPPAYRLSLRAMLFYNDRGTFSPDLIAHPVSLWNTIIGEGQSGGPSNATMIVAVVSGEGGSYVPERKVALTVTEGGRTILQRTVETTVLNQQGRGYVAFWVYDTGCEPLRLSARIVGQTPSTPVTARIPFACGE